MRDTLKTPKTELVKSSLCFNTNTKPQREENLQTVQKYPQKSESEIVFTCESRVLRKQSAGAAALESLISAWKVEETWRVKGETKWMRGR